MLDRIVYTDDWNNFKVLMEDEDFTHTPFVVNGNKAIALVRGEVPKELEILGTYAEVFASKKLDDKYKSVYDYTIDVSYMDEDGNPQTFTRPKEIGEIL